MYGAMGGDNHQYTTVGGRASPGVHMTTQAYIGVIAPIAPYTIKHLYNLNTACIDAYWCVWMLICIYIELWVTIYGHI